MMLYLVKFRQTVHTMIDSHVFWFRFHTKSIQIGKTIRKWYIGSYPTGVQNDLQKPHSKAFQNFPRQQRLQKKVAVSVHPFGQLAAVQQSTR